MLTLLLISISISISVAGCVPQGDPHMVDHVFTDDFDRPALGETWRATSNAWQIRDGAVHVQNARNHPLWLKRVLPRDVQIEFDVKSASVEGDIKVEVFGDGHAKATSTSYTATSYVVIFGGWDNRRNVIARMDEHGADRVDGTQKRVAVDQVYHMRIVRRGSVISVDIDGERVMAMDDPEPLQGRGHDHFGFNNWQSELTFDNLKITLL